MGNMSKNNANVFNCSLTNHDSLLRLYGKAESKDLNLLKLLYKYACYSPTSAILNRLDGMVSAIQMGSTVVCMDNLNGDFYYGLDADGNPTNNFPDPDPDPNEPSDPKPPDPTPVKNNPPTVSDNTLVIDENIRTNYDTSKKVPVPIYTKVYTFTKEDFLLNFADVDGDSFAKIVIRSIPTVLQLRYGNRLIQVSDEIDLRTYRNVPVDDPNIIDDTGGVTTPGIDPNGNPSGKLAAPDSNDVDDDSTSRKAAPQQYLELWKISDDEINDSMTYRVSDDNAQEPAWSIDTLITMPIAGVGNEPATTGDSVINVKNNVTTVLVSEYFTDTDPAYSDPESDPLDSIRVDSISGANTGQYLYLGVAVTRGQVISKAALDGGDFIHIGSADNSISTDSIQFSLRDAGSLIWVN